MHYVRQRYINPPGAVSSRFPLPGQRLLFCRAVGRVAASALWMTALCGLLRFGGRCWELAGAGAGGALAGTAGTSIAASRKAGAVMAERQTNHWFFS